MNSSSITQTISDRLKAVLRDLEKVTNDIEIIQAQVNAVANDDFLTRELNKPPA